jgi:ribosomal protein S18 acetylase RimI-like enzyme
MIRQFQPGDAEDCCKVIHECLASDSHLRQVPHNTFRIIESPQSIRRWAALFYVAVYESCNSVVGLAGLDMNEVRLLCVSPKHQSHGIGGAMMDHLEAMVPSSVFTDIFVYSAPSATGFYSRRGFRAMGEYAVDLYGETFQTIFMVKLLRRRQP